MQPLVLGLLSALIVSTVSLVGALTFFYSNERVARLKNTLLALAAGAMLGNAVLHLLPHALEQSAAQQERAAKPAAGEHKHDQAGHAHHHHDHDDADADEHDHDKVAGAHHEHSHGNLWIHALFLLGIFGFLSIDMFFHQHHDDGVKPLGYMVLFGDGLENFMDGLLIGGAYLISVPVGIAATVAVFIHEIPIELGDFGVLLHSGFTRARALMLNALSGLLSLVGVVVAFLVGSNLGMFSSMVPAFLAGGFVYMACSVLLPQIRCGSRQQRFGHLLVALVGVIVMALVLLLE